MKKPVVFLVVAVALLAVAAWLMPSTDPTGDTASPESAQPGGTPSYPTGPTAADKAKLEARKTLDVPPSPATGSAGTTGSGAEPAPSPAPSAQPRGKRDAVLTALPPTAADVIVMEAQTFLERPIIRAISHCLATQGMQFQVENVGLRAADLDRVALADLGAEGTLVVLTGDMTRFDASLLLEGVQERTYGTQSKVYTAAADTTGTHWNIGRFREALVVVGRPRAAVEQALDRLEGRAPSAAFLPESEQYGDAYGRLTATSLRRVFPAELSDQVEAAALGATFHVKATNDVLISADATGEPEASQALGKATAAALAARRAEAASEGDKATVKLLDTFRVRMKPDGFLLQAGFTEAYLEKQLGACVKNVP